jgi:thioredoxin 1
MDECNPAARCAGARHLVDQPVARRSARLHSRVEVGNTVADVMNARSSFGQEPAHRALSLQWLQQLYLGISEREGQYPCAVYDFGRMRLDPEDVAVKGHRVLQIVDSNADMGNTGAVRHRNPPEFRRPAAVRTATTSQENNKMGATNTPTVHVSDASFATEIEQAEGLVLVDFWATWCGPCQIVAPILEQLAGEYAGQAKVAKVDVDANQRTAMRFNVRSIPSILFFKNGRHVDTVVGAVPKATLEGKIKQHLS